MAYDGRPRPIHRSPRATHELEQVFQQLQLENNPQGYDDVEGQDYSDSDDEFPPPIPRRHPDSYKERPSISPGTTESPPRSPSHVNPLRSHPVTSDEASIDSIPAPAPTPTPAQGPPSQYRFSHPFRDELSTNRQIDAAPRRRPTNLVSYKPANQRLHPRLRRRTSLDTIASVTTTASLRDSEDVDAPDVETPSPSMFTLESEYPITPNVDLGPPPLSEPPESVSLPGSLRTASIDSTNSMHPNTPVSSTETLPHKGFLQKLKSGKRRDSIDKRKDSVGTDGGDRLVIERTVSVDQTSYRSKSSSASNPISSGTPSRYPNSEAGKSQSSSTWTASSHDISGLTPEELKKCKKKGINPSLFAEMKAARKGKWTSPIAGNTFLA
ncbi:hypothetical protein E8E13_011202 [Curvularia kusanoi]|uniref:Uncharacterized protein n=1 Tax=Curvularia kusanoi TaxID=90978 RepID=A0A9P4WBQ7_CURKU|nr:hypothetical protein E8E13_011202 [Curvularia kusanoi]